MLPGLRHTLPGAGAVFVFASVGNMDPATHLEKVLGRLPDHVECDVVRIMHPHDKVGSDCTGRHKSESYLAPNEQQNVTGSLLWIRTTVDAIVPNVAYRGRYVCITGTARSLTL
jgi:hypothetical protein